MKEYQVLLSPFDVRQGDFGGLLINAVTKSGTNEFHGSVYGYTRNQNLTRTQPYLVDSCSSSTAARSAGRSSRTSCFSSGVASCSSVKTPAIRLVPSVAPDSYVSQATIDQLVQIMTTKYGFAESGRRPGAEAEPEPQHFVRVDAYLPLTRASFCATTSPATGQHDVQPRAPQRAERPALRAHRPNPYRFSSKTNSSVAEFLTNLPAGCTTSCCSTTPR